MIELERDAEFDGGEVWADSEHRHVIVEETEETARYGSDGPGFYVRDEGGEYGPYDDLAEALVAADGIWDDVSLAPANRLRAVIEEGRTGEIGDFLLEYLATYGAVGIDVKALATRVFERVEEED